MPERGIGRSVDASTALYLRYLRDSPMDIGPEVVDGLLGPRQPMPKLVTWLVAEGRRDELRLMATGETSLHAELADREDIREGKDFAVKAGGPFREDENVVGHALRAMASLGLALVEDGPADEFLEAGLRWQREIGTVPALERISWRPAELAAGRALLEERLRDLRRLAGDDSASEFGTVVTLCCLAGALRRTRRAEVGVLFARKDATAGAAARLRVDLLPGLPPALVPDPARMSLFRCDSGFRAALERAWAHAGAGRVDGLVLWSIEEAAGPVKLVQDESLGLAFAVLLDEIARGRVRGLMPKRVVPSNYVVGRLDDEGRARQVGGYPLKLRAAAEHSFVVLPKDDLAEAEGATDGRDLKLRTARTWQEAADRARHRHPTIVVRNSLIALLLIGALIGGWVVNHQYNSTDQERRGKLAEREAKVVQGLIKGSLADAETDPPKAIRRALTAYRLARSPASRANLITSLTRTPYAGDLPGDGDLVAAPTGRFLLSISDDGEHSVLTVWDTTGPFPVKAATIPGVQEAAAGAGDIVWMLDGDSRLQVRDLKDPRNPVVRSTSAGPVGITTGLAVSPDGRTVAGGDRGKVVVLDVSDPVHPRRAGRTAAPATAVVRPAATTPEGGPLITDLQFSPNGKLLGVGGSYVSAQLWDVSRPDSPRKLGFSPDGEAFGVGFSPDGALFAAAMGPRESVARIWDVRDPGRVRQVSTLRDEVSGLLDVDFSPDGKRVATASSSGETHLWDLSETARPRRVTTLRHSSANSGLDTTFSADGGWLYTSGAGIRRWRTDPPAEPRVLARIDVDGDQTLVLPDGKTLVTRGLYDMSIWDISDRKHPRRLWFSDRKPWSFHHIALSPDGRTLAVTMSRYDEYRHQLWDISNTRSPRELTTFAITSDIVAAHTPVFSPDGRTLAVTKDKSQISLYDVAEPSQPFLRKTLLAPRGFTPLNPVASPLVFSPKGDILVGLYGSAMGRWDLASESPVGTSVPLPPRRDGATTSDGVKLTIADVGTVGFRISPPTLFAIVSTEKDGIGDIAVLGGPTAKIVGRLNAGAGTISPDQRFLATAGGDMTRTFDLTDLTTSVQLTERTDTLQMDEGATVFSPDRRTLVGKGEKGLELWDVGPSTAIADNPVAAACTIVRTGLSAGEWKTEVPGIPFRPVC